MSWSAERVRSGVARVAAAADATWAVQPQDPFLLANQRVWTQYCRLSRALQHLAASSQPVVTSSRTTECIDETPPDGARGGAEEGGEARERGWRRRTVRDVIPHSRLARYGNYSYDDDREQCYSSDASSVRCGCHCGHATSSDLTECWMLPQVEYWFRRLTDDGAGRRRDTLATPSDNLERYGLTEPVDPAEEVLHERLRSVSHLWPSTSSPSYTTSPSTSTSYPQSPLTSSTPKSSSASSSFKTSPPSLKMRVRRLAGRRAPRYAQTQMQPTFCPSSPKPLQCDTEIRFDSPPAQENRQSKQQSARTISHKSEIQRPKQQPTAVSRSRQSHRGNSVDSRSKNTPRVIYNRGKTPARPKNLRGERSGRSHDKRSSNEGSRPRRPKSARNIVTDLPLARSVTEPEKYQQSKSDPKGIDNVKKSVPIVEKAGSPNSRPLIEAPDIENLINAMPEAKKDTSDDAPTTSTKQESNANHKRLYSTVLSTCPPLPIVIPVTAKVKMQGLIRLTSKLAFPAISRKLPQVDSKFEELEREALEQYKASDESIDTKFRTLEKQAMEQYSGSGTSNSNTSCGSGQSGAGYCDGGHCTSGKCGEKSGTDKAGIGQCGSEQCGSGQYNDKQSVSAQLCTPQCETGQKASEQPSDQKSACNSVVDQKSPRKLTVESITIHSQNVPDLTRACTSSTVDLKNVHVPLKGEKKGKNLRVKPQRTASDTEESARGKGALRWKLHVMAPRKRCGIASDDEDESRKDGLNTRTARESKVSANGAGDHDVVGKT